MNRTEILYSFLNYPTEPPLDIPFSDTTRLDALKLAAARAELAVFRERTRLWSLAAEGQA